MFKIRIEKVVKPYKRKYIYVIVIANLQDVGSRLPVVSNILGLYKSYKSAQRALDDIKTNAKASGMDYEDIIYNIQPIESDF